MRPNKEIKDIINRINQGIASSSDKKILDAWYNTFDDSKTNVNIDSTLNALKQTIWSKISLKLVKPKSVKLRRFYIAGAAASVLLCGFLFYTYNSDQKKLSSRVQLSDEFGNSNVIVSSVNDFLDTTKYVELAKNAAKLNVRALQTGAGELIKVILPDGSKVSMNSNTTLQLKKDFGKEDSRIVYLDGEAYFDVKNNSNQKFIVRTKDQSIEVLGTKFNVRSYAKQLETVTALYEGKIELINNNSTVSLLVNPNELVRNDGQNLSKETKDLKNNMMWRQMKFSFDDEPIHDVIDKLSNWYGFVPELKGSYPSQRISGQLEQGMNIKDVLQVLENLTGGNFQLSNNKLTIQFSK